MREIEMLKFEIEKMREFSVDELREKMIVEYSDFDSSGVYKIEFDSNELLSVSKVEVIDGCFSVIDEERDYIEMRDGFVNCVVDDEYGYDFYRVDVMDKNDRLIELVSDSKVEMDIVEEEVEENCDLYKVKNGEYKDWYVLMCYDYGDSLCDIEVDKNKNNLVGV